MLYGTKRYGVHQPRYGAQFSPLMLPGIELLGKCGAGFMTLVSGKISAMTELTGNHTLVQGTALERPIFKDAAIIFTEGNDEHFNVGTNVDIALKDFYFFFRATIPANTGSQRIYGSDNTGEFAIVISGGGILVLNLGGSQFAISTGVIDIGAEIFVVVNCDRSGNAVTYINDMSTPETTIDISGEEADDIDAVALAIAADADGTQALTSTWRGVFGMGIDALLNEDLRKKLKAYR